jgi:hypothetical protein
MATNMRLSSGEGNACIKERYLAHSLDRTAVSETKTRTHSTTSDGHDVRRTEAKDEEGAEMRAFGWSASLCAPILG